MCTTDRMGFGDDELGLKLMVSFLLDKIILFLLIPPYPGQEVPANYLPVR